MKKVHDYICSRYKDAVSSFSTSRLGRDKFNVIMQEMGITEMLRNCTVMKRRNLKGENSPSAAT